MAGLETSEEMFDLRMSEGAKSLFEKVKAFIVEEVEPITLEFHQLGEDRAADVVAAVVERRHQAEEEPGVATLADELDQLGELDHAARRARRSRDPVRCLRRHDPRNTHWADGAEHRRPTFRL